MKTINNFILEKLHFGKEMSYMRPSVKPPKEETICYDIGGGKHKIWGIYDLNDIDEIKDRIDDLSDYEESDKRELFDYIKNKKYDERCEYLVYIDQHMGSSYLAFWTDDEDDVDGWPIVCYEFKDNTFN